MGCVDRVCGHATAIGELGSSGPQGGVQPAQSRIGPVSTSPAQANLGDRGRVGEIIRPILLLNFRNGAGEIIKSLDHHGLCSAIGAAGHDQIAALAGQQANQRRRQLKAAVQHNALFQPDDFGSQSLVWAKTIPFKTDAIIHRCNLYLRFAICGIVTIDVIATCATSNRA
ncbi:MAG: hypothetical protein WCJ40_16475 [Planctomycetota bacterium]